MIQIYGWGTTSFQGSSPDKLLEATVPVVTKETCQTKWPSVEDGMICAGGEEGTDTCQVRIEIYIQLGILNNTKI